MVNPYLCYATAFLVALCLYPLGWSQLYPRLTPATTIFLLITIVLHVAMAFVFSKRLTGRSSIAGMRSVKGPLSITLFIYVLWLAEFIHAGAVPLVHILLHKPFDYKLFGIPSLHVFVVTFSSFYTIWLFYQYLGNRSRILLALFIINLAAAILIYNRGMFLFNLAGCVFIFLSVSKTFRLRYFAIAAPALVLLSYLFGVMGSMRVSNESNVSYTNEGFLSTAAATSSFRDSKVPAEFLWSYIYTTSPIANLQENISDGKRREVSLPSLLRWFNGEVLPDFISKRVNAYAGLEKEKVKTIQGPFNATTVYAGSFASAGWWGLALMAIVILLIPFGYMAVIPESSPFFLPGLVIMNTIFLFMVFDNTLRFTGLSFQLAYPILLHFASARWKWVKDIFVN